MSKKTRQFTAFGVSYKTEQFSAIRGLEIMAQPDDIHPCTLLSKTAVRLPNGEWADLEYQDNVNDYVIDVAGIIVPRLVLKGLMSLVNDFNFQFLEQWNSIKVPRRFMEGATTVSSTNVDPMASQLIQDGIATLKELEDYYSLEDAFKMFDTIMAKGVNAALSQEASMRNSRKG